MAMVTDREIERARGVAEGGDPSSTTVDDIASHELGTVWPEQDVEEARRQMAQHELGPRSVWSWRGIGS